MKRSPLGIELFCGCGGLSTGFLDAGIRIVAGFDIDRRAIEAYEYNHSHRGSHGFATDLASATGRQLLDIAGVPCIDILVGGPPCQPFSIVGKRQGNKDQRANLVLHFLRLTRELAPEAVFFENVPNLSVIEGGNLLAQFISGLEEMRYAVRAEIVAAADFGVPQIRRRLLVVGIRRAGSVRLPEQTHGSKNTPGLRPYRTAHEALHDLPDAADFGECGIYNHEATEHSADMLARFAVLGAGKRELKSFHDRLHPDRPSYTLRAGTGNFSPLRPVHYHYDRVVTARESARLQGFSDDFIWPDWIPRLQQYRQIGNAVPPPVAAAVASSLADQMNWCIDVAATRGNPLRRPPAITLSDGERRAKRRSRIRGASLGRRARGA